MIAMVHPNRPYPLYELPRIESLRHMLEMQAHDDPDRISFRFRKGKEIAEKTASGFFRDVCALGTWLLHHGIQEKHVALIDGNSYPWLVVYFAVILSGNVIVPIDKDLSQEDLIRLLRHSESSHVFTGKKLAASLAETAADVSFHLIADLDAMIAEGDSLLLSGDHSFLDVPQDLEKLAMIVYTSGTTGASRGVMLSQANLVADINSGCHFFNPEGQSLSVLPFHHTFGLVVSMLMYICWGVTVFINTGIRYLMADFKDGRPVTAMLVPLHIQTFHRMIMENAKKTGKYRKLRTAMKLSLFLYSLGIDVRSSLMHEVRDPFGGDLKYIFIGGAALDPFYEKEFRAWGIELITAYGATECSPGIAANRNFYHREGSAGRAIECCELRIADDGEVMIRGENVMMGYYHDEAATAEALHDGWYASGDIGYLDEDGFLFLTGRKKNLIILSDGENVSPEKLEAGIERIEGVSEAMVYEDNGSISVMIYPDEEHMNRQEWFDEQIKHFNDTLPPTQRIKTVRLRSDEFPKSTSKKILRHEVRKELDHV